MNDILYPQTKTMSSLEISELTGKQHKHVMEAIRNMEDAWTNVCGSKFRLTSRTVGQPNGGTRDVPCYELTKTECLYIATKFNDEARAKLVLRWEQLETERREPTRKELALMVIRSEEEKERLMIVNRQQEQIIREQTPKVVFADAVIGSQSSILVGELAKILRQNGIEIGEKRLFAWLREKGYLGTSGERYNIPNQRYLEMGLFVLKTNTYSVNGVMKTKNTTKVTGKGVQYFLNKFLNK